MLDMFFAIFFIMVIALSVAAGMYASRLKRSPIGWGLVAFFLSPFVAFLFLLALGEVKSKEVQR